MKLDVPYYSQHLDIKDKKWRNHSCPIVCLGMVFDYFHTNKDAKVGFSSLDDLLHEGFELRGMSEYGWTHDALVLIAHNHGLAGYKEEFRSLFPDIEDSLIDYAVEKITKELHAEHPVIVSVMRKWEKNSTFHTVVLTGATEEGFYYNDPDSYSSKEGKDLFVPLKLFLDRWRGLAVFLRSYKDEIV
jgi:hypothetical protein